MEKLIFFYLSYCPYCKKADKFIEELKQEKSLYNDIEIQKIEERENKELADSYDYYNVPCFFYKGEKLFEGAPTKVDIKNVLDKVLNS